MLYHNALPVTALENHSHNSMPGILTSATRWHLPKTMYNVDKNPNLVIGPHYTHFLCVVILLVLLYSSIQKNTTVKPFHTTYA